MIDETVEYVVAKTEDDAIEIWDSGEDVWDTETAAWEDWVGTWGNDEKGGICFKLSSTKKVEALPKKVSRRNQSRKPKLLRKERRNDLGRSD